MKLHLLIDLEGSRYALPAAAIEEIAPLLAVTPLPGAPRGIAGAVNFRGETLPVVDLAMLLLGRPARALMSTRLVIVKYPGADGEPRRLGCIAEHATEILRCDPEEFKPAGVELGGIDCAGAGFLGPVRPDRDGLVQRITIEALLPEALRAALFCDPPP